MALRHSFLAIIAAMSGAASSSVQAQLTIRVLDEDNRGVSSTVQVSGNGDNWNHLAYTPASGEIDVNWSCQTGRRLRAVPRDSETYFNSAPQDCAMREPLRVTFRSRHGRRTGAIAISDIVSTGLGYTFHLVVARTVVSSKVDQVVLSTEGVPTAQCQYNITTSNQPTLYRAVGGGQWQRADSVLRGAGVSLSLSAVESGVELTTGEVAGSCASATMDIYAAENAALARQNPQFFETSGWADQIAEWVGASVATEPVVIFDMPQR